MTRPLHLLILHVLVTILLLPYTSPAPQAWRPQGRFGKRAAWRPQSRFGKRPSSSLGSSDFSFLPSGRVEVPKNAWPQYGKREDELTEDVDGKRAWKPQGRFGKRGEMDVDLPQLDLNRFGSEESVEKRAWKPQGRFGKRLLRSQRWRSVIEELKRAWRPQGRFGKRADSNMVEDMQDSTENEDIVFNRSGNEDVVMNPESGEACIEVDTEHGPVYKCFRSESEEDPLRASSGE